MQAVQTYYYLSFSLAPNNYETTFSQKFRIFSVLIVTVVGNTIFIFWLKT